MNIVERAKSILLSPRPTWEVIDTEQTDTASLYTGYLMILAAIPAVCGFIGMSIIGMGMFGVSMRVPFLAGLANMLVSYVLSLVGVYVLAKAHDEVLRRCLGAGIAPEPGISPADEAGVQTNRLRQALRTEPALQIT